MDVKTIQFLWQYMVHADEQIAEAAGTLSEEGYRREQNISFGSVHKLLLHAVAAQQVWLKRLRGETAQYEEQPYATLAEVVSAWRQVDGDLLNFAAGISPERLQAAVNFHTRAGQPYAIATWALMLHVADHATYHRGQLNSMIKLAGGKPSPVMLLPFAAKQYGGR